MMETVTLSSKYQVVVPKKIRERLGLSPGQKIQVILLGERIELLPLRKAKELRGFLAAIGPGGMRERDR